MGKPSGVEMVNRQFAASDDADTVGLMTAGSRRAERSCRAKVRSDWRLRLSQLDARLAGR